MGDEHEVEPFINRLPVELLACIFEHVVPLVVWRTSRYDIEPDDYPEQFKLGTVCRRWRDIAWSTPNLWNSLPLVLRQSNNLNIHRVGLASEWLSRSGDLPLFLRVCSRYPFGSGVGDELLVVLSHFLNSVVHRAEELSLFLHSYIVSEINLPVLSASRKPMLKRLNIQTFGGGLQGSFNAKSNLAFSPSTLVLQYIPPSNINIDWESLTTFQGCNILVSYSIQVLEKAVNLTMCTFWPMFNNLRVDEFRPVIISSVRHLFLTTITTFWPCVRLPCLEKLRVRLDRESLEPIRQCIVASGCAITSLELLYLRTSIAATDLIPLLEEIPTLQSLVFTASGITRGLLLHLGFSSQFLPNLTEFRYQGPIRFEWAAISAMFKLSHRPLQIVHFAIQFKEGSTDIIRNIDQDTLGKLDDVVTARKVDLRIVDMAGRDFIHRSRVFSAIANAV